MENYKEGYWGIEAPVKSPLLTFQVSFNHVNVFDTENLFSLSM